MEFAGRAASVRCGEGVFSQLVLDAPSEVIHAVSRLWEITIECGILMPSQHTRHRFVKDTGYKRGAAQVSLRIWAHSELPVPIILDTHPHPPSDRSQHYTHTVHPQHDT